MLAPGSSPPGMLQAIPKQGVIPQRIFQVLETAVKVYESRKEKIPMRLAALSLGIKRVVDAKKLRGLYP